MFTNNIKNLQSQNNSLLATRSYKLYEAIAKNYIQLDKHWGNDIDLILKEIDKMEEIILMDAGCGPGWYIKCCLELAPKRFKKLIGIDFSKNMIKEAKKNSKGDSRVVLIEQSLLEAILPADSVDVAICMNNVLGNLIVKDIPSAFIARKKALEGFHSVLRKNGKLILSIYNRELLKREDYISNTLWLDDTMSDYEKGDFVVHLILDKKHSALCYYTHWFIMDEIINLLSETGFTLLHIESREKRLVTVAKKINGG